MTKKTGSKVLTLMLTGALCLSLTGCYVPPDQITDTGVSLNNNDLPWPTANPVTATPVVTAEPLQQPVQITAVPQQGFDPGTIVLVTPTPTVNVYVPVTIAPNQGGAPTPTLKAATPSPTTFLFQKGSKGATVRTIQQRLKDLGYLSANVDGDFGASTEAAVKAFQTTNGLHADGKVGITTYNKLTSSTALRAGSTPTPKAITTLKEGSKGSSVRTVQQRLKNLGYFTGTVDGNYGSATAAAVKAFQRKNGLTPDGKVGTTTWTRLNSSSAINAKSTEKPGATVGILKLGSTGGSVTAAQKRLHYLGFYNGNMDGVFSATMEVAVRAFQKRNGLAVDGQIGPTTLARLNSDKAKAAEGFVTPKPSAKPTATGSATATPRPRNIVAQQGDNNATVRAIQNRLKELGYLSASATGYFGDATLAAVKRFQANNSLSQSGVVDVRTQDKMNSSSAKSAGGNTVKPASTPIAGRHDHGDTVTRIQERLKELGYFSGPVTGTFGSVTEAAVRDFQKVNGLVVSGAVDKATMDHLMSQKAKPRSSASPKPTATPDSAIVAKQGDRGQVVTNIQNRLKELGYFSGETTEFYGSKTADAVKSFQKHNRLAETGNCDKSTYSLLMGKKAKGLGTATPKPTATPNGSIIAKRGDNNAIVTEIQKRLIELGYMKGSANGSYGASTVTAVEEFQVTNRLAKTGKCDQSTYNLLLSKKAKAKATATPKPTATPNGNIIAQRGDNNAIVSQIQARLSALGYFSGSANGSYGASTVTAVRSFQTVNKLAATGKCDQSTYNLLMGKNAKPKPTATPAGDVVMQRGARGLNVGMVQTALGELGYMDTVTNYYGTTTEAAVKRFQAVNKLPQTGICDQKTYDLIVSRKGKPAATSTPSGTIIAQRGTKGQPVKEIQERLKTLGYFSGDTTENFGSKTEEAVRQFQSLNSLPVNGIVDQKTYNVLFSSKAKPYNAVTATPHGNLILKRGDSGELVTNLQVRLFELGYFTGSTTGNYGSKTENAVSAFQANNKLPVTGACDEKTYDLIFSKKAKPTGAPSTTPPSSTIIAERGDKGDTVTQIQSRLYALRYMTASATGNFGSATETAVKTFQKVHNLAITGVVDKTTYNLLMSSKAKTNPSADVDPTAKPVTDIILEYGSKGKNVTTLQNRLIELGYLTGKATGTFEGATMAAVEAYQKKAGIWQDGKAGPQTLISIYGSSPKRSSTLVGVLGITLQVSDQGDAVRCLQTRLRALKYMSSSANGSYGENTMLAVMEFQIKNGLTDTGKANPATLSAIFNPNALVNESGAPVGKSVTAPAAESEIAAAIAPSKAADVVMTQGSYTTLRSGDNSEAVTLLQTGLHNLGYLSAKATGSYGKQTVAAVKSFQKDHGLRETGIAGPTTQRILFGSSWSGPSATLRQNSSGSDVAALQYTLWELGYYDGIVNGLFSQSTEDAVKAFQTANGIKPVNGQVASKTRAALFGKAPVGAN